jgi:hypothetical protein
MICHQYRCIFIHIPKAAGQSIESVFLKLLNLTWETRAPLLLCPNANPEVGPPRLAHLKAREYVGCSYLPQEEFSAYFKFAFVRNPWDRLVSFYKYMGPRNGLPFKEFLMGPFRKDLWVNRQWFVGPQSSFVCDSRGNLLVDFLGRFERLQADFNTVAHRLALPSSTLPHRNKSKRQKFASFFSPRELLSRVRILFGSGKPNRCRSYQDYYDDESKDLVAQLYADDLERFGYRFGQPAVHDGHAAPAANSSPSLVTAST